MEYEVLIPVISTASFSVNPVNINGATKISVSVIEQTITLEPEKIYSGEIYAGEV